ncbi:AAA family ATPase [Microseira sp. BLCC-F43]|jgi:hypothetical protein|uniref:AAA family ATPase n=1 Tax=Microseira sp. BLCC-F43 TaxID=3153602 RepID=UPI0035BA02BB
MNPSDISEIATLIKAGQPLIACESPIQERERILTYILKICMSIPLPCYLWNLGSNQILQLKLSEFGSLEFIQSQIPLTKSQLQVAKDYFDILPIWNNYQGSGVLILENIYPWIKANMTQDADFLILSEWVKSNLINLYTNSRTTTKIAILLGARAEITPELAPQIPLVTQELPEIHEILDALKSVAAEGLPPHLSIGELEAIAHSSIGLYISDIINALSAIHHRYSPENAKELAEKLFNYKVQLFNRLYDIEFLPAPQVPLGGLDRMLAAFKKFKRLLSPLAKAYKLKVPKGVLLVGPPGTGKSHAAKVCAQIVGVPLILVDWGNFRGYGNEAEPRLKKLLKLTDRLNRVVIYFDDFDKAFAGFDDGGLGQRLAGTLLTWMQERTSDAIVIASVNRMEWLPPELTRAGRFDYIYKVDLPNHGERNTIFNLHLARFDARFKNGGDPYTHESRKEVIKRTQRCVGSEIQTIVERAAATTFYQMFTDENAPIPSVLLPLEISAETLLEERKQIKPLAIREADRVESMRNKADLQALPSSSADESVFAISNVDIYGD